jgi:hypothetical protein
LIESMTSYVARLAAAHLVRPRCLLAFVCAPPVNYLRALNSMHTSTAAVVDALESQTGVSGLQFLTLLPWRRVLSSINSLAKMQRWCPQCLNEWRSAGTPIYYPLLWCLATARCCIGHACELASRCPNPTCQQEIALLSTPGRCSACGSWLGGSVTAPSPRTYEDIWFTDASGWLLRRGQALSGPLTSDGLRNFFAGLFGVLGHGHVDPFRVRLGLPADMLYRWRAGTSLPSVDMLLTFCARLNVEPQVVLDGGALPDLSGVDGRGPWHFRAAPRAANTRLDCSAARKALQRALEMELSAAPSLSQVADQLGVSYQLLRYHFPELTRGVCARNTERRALQSAHLERDCLAERRHQGACIFGAENQP